MDKIKVLLEINEAVSCNYSVQCSDIGKVLNCLDSLQFNLSPMDTFTMDLIDKELFEEIIKIASNISIYFGKTMCDIKCILTDSNGLRDHDVYLQYKGSKKLVISNTRLPHSPLLDKEYSYMEEVVLVLKNYIDSLDGYFHELERLDTLCFIMEPVNPSYKDDYRRIYLDDRTWLHMEVTQKGLARNIHLIGHSEKWQQKLQEGLLSWDHDKDIVDNIMSIFELIEFPVPKKTTNQEVSDGAPKELVCSICLCPELSDSGVPQPLCQNATCGIYFHRNCLFQDKLLSAMPAKRKFSTHYKNMKAKRSRNKIGSSHAMAVEHQPSESPLEAARAAFNLLHATKKTFEHAC